MKNNRSQQLRASLAREAARLMYEEGVKQYFTAKQLAAKRLLGRAYGNKIRFRPKDLPSNGEIQSCLKQIVQIYEGEQTSNQLFAMRIIALETMYSLKRFRPALIGSVSTGQIRSSSDIDLHLFCNDLEEITVDLDNLAYRYKLSEVSIQKNSLIKIYTHIYFENIFPIELSIYPENEIRVTSRSSTDGKPIARLKTRNLEKLLQQEHEHEWLEYLSSGTIKAYRS